MGALKQGPCTCCTFQSFQLTYHARTRFIDIYNHVWYVHVPLNILTLHWNIPMYLLALHVPSFNRPHNCKCRKQVLTISLTIDLSSDFFPLIIISFNLFLLFSFVYFRGLIGKNRSSMRPQKLEFLEGLSFGWKMKIDFEILDTYILTVFTNT